MELHETEIKDKYGKAYSMRSAQPDEVEELMEFVRQASEETLFFPWSPEGCPKLWENPEDYIRFFLASPRQALMVLYDGEKLVGLSELANLDDEKAHQHRFTLALAFLKSYFGRGLAESVHEVGEKLGLSLGYEQMEAGVDSRNERCKHTLEKIGFKLCGIKPRFHKFDDGTYRDSYFLVKQIKGDDI